LGISPGYVSNATAGVDEGAFTRTRDVAVPSWIYCGSGAGVSGALNEVWVSDLAKVWREYCGVQD
jgi:hypothetical protein